ncbi:hypothetical protein [uncultured Campylobacter sp.]|nr:hypothetical protein [uncultured Campylobacter sp.]
MIFGFVPLWRENLARKAQKSGEAMIKARVKFARNFINFTARNDYV